MKGPYLPVITNEIYVNADAMDSTNLTADEQTVSVLIDRFDLP